MRILLLIDNLGSGGAQRQMVGLATLLQEKGYEIKVIYYHPIYFYRLYLEEHHVKNEYVLGAQNLVKRIFLIARAVREFHPEVVISYLDTPNLIACLLKAGGMKYRLIASERNTSQSINWKEKIKFYLLRWADVIVPNSYSQERFIKNYYPNLFQRVHTITNFVDTKLFIPKIYRTDGKRRILVVARVSRQKNTLTFLQSINRLKKEGLVFLVDWYGRADDDTYLECKAYINAHQLYDVFSFHEPIEDIVREYQKSDIFCLPSLYEGFPNAICEAMSCGLPILCSNVCDNSMLVENEKNGFLFNPNDIIDITNKIKRMLMLSNEEITDMCEYSRKIAEKYCSAKTFIEKYVNVIEA